MTERNTAPIAYYSELLQYVNMHDHVLSTAQDITTGLAEQIFIRYLKAERITMFTAKREIFTTLRGYVSTSFIAILYFFGFSFFYF